jgi:hypothetical protein
MPMLRNCDVCLAKYGVGDARNWHEPERWPSECMGHFHKRKGEDKIGLQIMKDIEPYKNTVDGGVITSRKHHRDFLKARGLVEVGNENVPQKYIEPPPVAPDIVRAMQETGYWKQ